MLKNFLSVILVFLMSVPVMAIGLNGAGATFPAPIYSKWFSQYAKETGVQVNYQAIGSGGGVRQFTAGVVDFGATDAFMSNSEIKSAGGGVIHIPTVIGAVAIVYNLPGVEGLKLDADTLAGIYLGDITKWNDSRITSLNPGLNLPDKNITVVRRSDGSGTTSIFTNYLTKVSTKWAGSVGEGKSVSWPVGVGGKGNFGVAGVVQQVSGAVGYVELAYAIENKLSYVVLKNKAGKFVNPSIEATTAGAAGTLASIPADFRINLTNPSGVKSYPIIGLTWIVVKQNQKDKTKGQTLKDLLTWCLKDGQNYAESLHYAPLPGSLAQKVLTTISTIE